MEFKRKGPPRGGAGGKSAARPSGDRKPYAGRKPAEGGGFGDRSAPPARGYGARKPAAGPKRDFDARPARSGEGKTYGARKPAGEGQGYAPRKPYGEGQGYAARKPYGEGQGYAPRKPLGEGRSESYRSGPRARAAQEQRYADPRQRAERPGRSAVISLEPDLARRFPDSAAVNAALRMVLELAELVGPRGARETVVPRPAPVARAETQHEAPAAELRFDDDLDE